MQDDALRKAIGSRIMALGKDKKLSQKELATPGGVSQRHWHGG